MATRCTYCGCEGEEGKTLQRRTRGATHFSETDVTFECGPCFTRRLRKEEGMDPAIKKVLIFFAIVLALCLLFEGVGELRSLLR